MINPIRRAGYCARLQTVKEPAFPCLKNGFFDGLTHIPYMKVYANRGVNFFTSGSKEMISLLNQYIDGAIDRNHFASQYASMIKMV